MLTLSKTPVDIDASCRRIVNMIAVESDYLSDMKDVLLEALPLLKQKISNFVVQGQDDVFDKHMREIFTMEGKIKYKTSQLDLMTYGENFMSVPAGFRGHLIDYGVDLIQAVNDSKNTLTNVLSAINLQLATTITNKDMMLSVKDETRVFNDADKNREKVNKELGEFITSATSVSKLPMRDVLYRFADIQTLVIQSKDVTRAIKAINLAQIKDKISELLGMSDMLIKAVKGEGTEKVSPVVAKNISAGLYSTAKYVEFVAALHYDAVVFVEAVHKLLDQIMST